MRQRHWCSGRAAVVWSMCFVAVTLTAGGCRAWGGRSQSPVVADFEGLFPAAFADGWAQADAVRVYAGSDLFNHIDGAAELFVELGFARAGAVRYTRESAQLGLEVYEMTSPTAARALFYYYRGRGQAAEGVAGRNVGNAYQVLVQQGRYFVQVNNFTGDATLAAAVRTLANEVQRMLPADEPVALLDLLPTEKRIAGSERIIRGPVGLQSVCELGAGDVLQLQGATFGVAADYPLPTGETQTVLVVPYANDTAANAAFTHFTTHLDPYLKVLTLTPTRLEFRDAEGRHGQAVRAAQTVRVKLRSVTAF